MRVRLIRTSVHCFLYFIHVTVTLCFCFLVSVWSRTHRVLYLSGISAGVLSRLHTSVTPRICIHSWLSVDFKIGFAVELNVFSKNAAFKMLHRDRVKCISPGGTDDIMRISLYGTLTVR